MAEKRVYGIDLGTTYSCISYVDEHGKPVVIPNSSNQLTTPSVVYFEDGGGIIVGQTAKDSASLKHTQVISTVKRVMGDPNWTTLQGGREYTPQEVSSLILKQLASDAEKVTHEKVENVVITCPAYFGVNQKEATKQAGELAGLNVLYVIPEPTAAAIAYGMEQTDDQVVMVYDLGGGTFDVTLIEVKAAEIKVICTGGDHSLGGVNWDESLVNYFAGAFAAEHGASVDAILNDPEAFQDLKNDAEARKLQLSSRASVTQKVSYDGERAAVEVTRAKFDELTAALLERTLSLTDDLLSTAKDKGYTKVDKILLVGGSTYMPQVIESVRKKFPFEVLQFDPNQSVAKGAALFGYSCYLKGKVTELVTEQTGKKVEDLGKVDPSILAAAQAKVAAEEGMSLPALIKVSKKVVNVLSKSFGVVVVDPKDRIERVTNLLVVDQPAPAKFTRVFSTIDDNQSGVLLRCIESTERKGPNEGSFALDVSQVIGSAELVFKNDLPAGSKIELSFDIGEDGLLTVSGRDLTTHSIVSAMFQTASVLSREVLEEKKKFIGQLAVSN